LRYCLHPESLQFDAAGDPRQNLAAAELKLPTRAIEELNDVEAAKAE
jgi:hypothetical protein